MIRLVTDSAANLPEQIVRQFNIEVVPLKVIIGEETYREGVDISAEQFYDLLSTSEVMPTTSQPAPQDFADVYEPILDAGDEIVSIHLSSDLSGTYNSAVQGAALFEDAPISIVDTRLVSAGQALVVVAAARALDAGATRNEIVTQLQYMRRRTSLLFVLDTLEYLKRGGRIGAASAFIGTMLRIKPILQIQEGVVQPLDRVRSRRRALERLTDVIYDRFGDRPVWVGLAHAQTYDEANELLQSCHEHLDVEFELTSVVGPVVGTHGGPGTIGVAVMPAPDSL